MSKSYFSSILSLCFVLKRVTLAGYFFCFAGKPYRDPCCCLLASCPWLRWADMGICGGRKPARNYVTDLCSYLWLHISGAEIELALDSFEIRQYIYDLPWYT